MKKGVAVNLQVRSVSFESIPLSASARKAFDKPGAFLV